MPAFSIGPITVYRYGIMYLISFIIGYIRLSFLGKKLSTQKNNTAKTRLAKILTTKLDDLVIAIIIGVMIGGRLGEIFIYNLPYYIDNPLKIFYVREGGMSFIGGIIGVIIAVCIFLSLERKKAPTQHKAGPIIDQALILFDHVVTIVPCGIMLGRIGNFLNRELYGITTVNKAVLSRITDTSRFDYTREILFVRHDIYTWMENIGLIFDYGTATGELRLNTNFLASFFEGLILLVIIQILYRTIYTKGKKKAGGLSGIFLIGYSIIRFLLEFVRQDSQYELIAGLSYSQWRFVGFIGLGIRLIYRNSIISKTTIN